jgi:hypothetical protein
MLAGLFPHPRSSTSARHMSKDTPLHNVPTIFVTANDGTLFSCTAHRIAEPAGTWQLRWKLTDPAGLEHVGPPYLGRQAPTELQRLVSQWWDATRALAQSTAGGNPPRR